MPNVDKVVFVVDRIALTKQTEANYKAYDPEGSIDIDGKTIRYRWWYRKYFGIKEKLNEKGMASLLHLYKN